MGCTISQEDKVAAERSKMIDKELEGRWRTCSKGSQIAFVRLVLPTFSSFDYQQNSLQGIGGDEKGDYVNVALDLSQLNL